MSLLLGGLFEPLRPRVWRLRAGCPYHVVRASCPPPLTAEKVRILGEDGGDELGGFDAGETHVEALAADAHALVVDA